MRFKKSISWLMSLILCCSMLTAVTVEQEVQAASESEVLYDFKGLSQLPDGWSVKNPTTDGLSLEENGAVIHTTGKDGAAVVENQLQYDKKLTGDWQVEVHSTTNRPLQGNWEQYGIYFVNHAGDAVTAQMQHNGSPKVQMFIANADGSYTHESPVKDVGTCSDIYYRLRYVDNQFEMYYSFDNAEWEFIGTETPRGNFDEGTLQIFATNQRNQNPSYDATVEYCKIIQGTGVKEQWTIGVEENGCCDVTWTSEPEKTESGQVVDGSDVTFSIIPKKGKIIGRNGIVLEGVVGAVAKNRKEDGSWEIVASKVKSNLTLKVNESVGATGITVDGVLLRDFDPDKTEYIANVVGLPVKVAATAPDDAEISIKQAAGDDLTATVTVTLANQTVVYTIQMEVTPETTQMSNPYLPVWETIPDGEPYVFEDPDHPGKYRLYVYGSHDEPGFTYCGDKQVLWSAPVEDLSKWRYHGEIYSCHANGAGRSNLFAPDVAYKNGIYYMYVHDWGHGQVIRVATSDRPDGPFTYPQGHDNAVVKNPGDPTGDRVDFDPGVLVDDDGKAYLYWGASSRHQGFRSGELEEDMLTIKAGTQTSANIDMDFSSSVGIQDGPFDYFEASSPRKIEDGAYVLVYSQKVPLGYDDGVANGDYRGRLAYAYSDNPLGPWTYGGVIIDNGGENLVPGKLNSYQDGSNHGSIIEMNGQWYVFYHRNTGNVDNIRQGMVEPIEVNVTVGADGKKIVSIPQVEMTSQGMNKDGLDPYRTQSVGHACFVANLNTTNLSYRPFIHTGTRTNPDYSPVRNITNGAAVGFKYMNFGTGAHEGKVLQMDLDIQSKGVAGIVEIYIDSPNSEEGTMIGSIPVAAGHGEYETIRTNVNNVTGKHALFFVFTSEQSGEICEISQFRFYNDGDPNAVSSVTLNQSDLKLKTGTQEKLTASVFPESVASQNVIWTSSKQSVATVQDGLVTAVSEGTAIITATVGGKSAACTVRVRDNMNLQSFDFTRENLTKDDVKLVWDVVRENDAKWDVGDKGMVIATEKGDLYTNTNTAMNMFCQDAPGDWEVETSFELDKLPYQNYHQAGIMVYQDDDNYLKFMYTGNNSGKKAIEINTEQNQSFSGGESVSVESKKIWLRLKKTGDVYSPSYSTDGTNFVTMKDVKFSLKDVKMVLTANNGTGNADEIKSTFKYFHVMGEEMADKTLLQKTYTYALTQNTDGVTDSAAKFFVDALAAAKEVLDDPNATQEEVNAAWENLLRGIWGLGIVKGEKAELKALIDRANLMNEEDYVADYWPLLEKALAEAEKVYADEDATQDVIDAAKEALAKAIDAQELKPVKAVNKDILKILIDKADSMLPNADKYVTANWPQLVDALTKAKEVYDNEEATQEEVDQAADALNAAILAQRFKADKSNLEDLLKKVEGLNLNGYTAESVQAFKAALARAIAVMADDTLSESEQRVVENAVKALADAADALEKKDSKAPTTGDSASMLWIFMLTIVSVGTVLSMKKRKVNR